MTVKSLLTNVRVATAKSPTLLNLDLVLYATYLNIEVDGLQALAYYNFQNQAWGQVHHQVCSQPIVAGFSQISWEN